MIFALVVGIVIFYVTGVILIIKSYADIPDPKTIASKAELDEIRSQRDKIQQEEQALLGQLESIGKQFQDAKASSQAYQEELSKELAAAREAYASDIQTLEAQGTQYKREAEKLKSGVQVILTRIKDVDAGLLDMKKQYELKLASAQQSLIQLQTEKEKWDQMAREQISAAELTKNIQKLEQEKQTLLAHSAEETKALEEKIALLQSENKGNSEALAKLEERLTESQNENQSVQAELLKARQLALEVAVVEKAPARAEEVSVLTKQLAGLQTAKNNIEQALANLQAENKMLTEKENILQAELTKSRVRALGLEKIYQGMKVQLENTMNRNSSGG